MLTIKKTVQDSSENSERVEVSSDLLEYLFALRIFKKSQKDLCVCVCMCVPSWHLFFEILKMYSHQIILFWPTKQGRHVFIELMLCARHVGIYSLI